MKEERKRILDIALRRNPPGEPVYQEYEYLECVCAGEHHLVRISVDRNFDDRDWPPEITITVQLNRTLNVWKRIWHAVKYVIGLWPHNAETHWDWFILDVDDIDRLRGIFTKYEATLAEWQRDEEKGE